MPRRLLRHPLPWATALLAGLAYVPLLLTAPGRVGADTKTYLYLDPARLLGRAWSMWDPNIGLGTVSHQTIGYLFPMGPYYWLLETVGLPDWVAQRLWLGTLLFAAGTGVVYLLRTLGWSLGPAIVAGLAYMLSPYWLDYAARISAILLPWAGLPWMVALAARSLRHGGWRYPACFALVVALVGGVNATALVYAGIGPVLWFVHAGAVTREVRPGQAVAAAARIGVLTLAVSLWWIAGLVVQGAYGVDILRYTETIPTVARTSLASEVLRGLGYWFFYGRDKLGPWIRPAVDYTQSLWLIAATFAVPALAFAGAALARFRERTYFLALVVVGAVLAVGTHPYDDPSPVGAVLKAAATGSTAGLAMRSSARAVPLVVLGVAVLLGAAVAALVRRARTAGAVAGVLAAGLVVAAQPSLLTGDVVDPNLDRPEDVPAYWMQAAAHLDRRDDGTRILEIPGADFAAYRWGNTVDPITPGLLDRPYVARELIPYGGDATADLLNALDRRMQEGVFEPAALSPLARYLAAGDVVVRADLQFERYNTPRPRRFWPMVASAPGLGPPAVFGPADPPVTRVFPMQDETALGTPATVPDPPEVSAFPVVDPVPIVRTAAASGTVVLAGDGEGLVDAAAAGLVDGRQPVVYAASGTGGVDGGPLVVTDTNRRRARRWSTVRENTGYTEQPGEEPLEDDPGDARLDLFPGAGDRARTTVSMAGDVAAVRATRYGNPVSYTAEDRPAHAVDGDPLTAWRVGAFDDVIGERLLVSLRRAATADHVTLTQPVTGPRNRFITRARLTFDGDTGSAVDVDLTEASRAPGGQRVEVGRRTFRSVELEVLADSAGEQASYIGWSAVGIAELAVDGVRAVEIVELPSFDAEPARPLALVLTRLRAAPIPPRTDEEVRLVRGFSLSGDRSFALRGTARLSEALADDAVDRLLGLPGIARSSGRLRGALAARAAAAVDGDPATAWMPGFGGQEGHWLEVDAPRPVTFDRLDLVVRADGRHSVPARVRVVVDGRAVADLDVPPVVDRPEPDATVAAPVALGRPVTGRRVRLEVLAVRVVETTDFFSERPITMPVAVAELGLPGVRSAAATGAFDTGCRADLVSVDGTPVPVRVAGDRAAAAAFAPLDVQACAGVPLAAGRHVLRTAVGRDAGVDVDRLVLASGDLAPRPAPGPAVEVLGSGRTSYRLKVGPSTEPFWLVLGQSRNDGWRAGGLGRSRLVDGYANGWLVPPGPEREITLRWTPQRGVNVALVLSSAGFALCLVLALRRKRVRPVSESGADGTHLRPGGGGRPSAVVAVVGAGLVAGAVTRPELGLLAAGGVAVALWAPRLRPLLLLGAGAAVTGAGAYVVAAQARYRYPPEFEWPTFFPTAHTLALVAIALVIAEVAAALARRQAERFSNTSA